MIAFRQDRASVDLPGNTPLLAVIRDHLGLFGSRFGCGAEQCGACMLLIDGHAECSCTRTLDSVSGRNVVTVEGLGNPAAPHPLQEAFLAEQAGQCGYCLSGMLVSAASLLRANPDPDEAAVRRALNGNLCRCGAHNRIIRAVLRAAVRCAKDRPRERIRRAKPKLPGSLNANRILSQWITFEDTKRVTIHPGKVEIGQGILTALAQIAADELDVAFERVDVKAAATDESPDEGVTSGSRSVVDSGMAIRHACAAARSIFLSVVAQRTGVSRDQIRVVDGIFVGPRG